MSEKKRFITARRVKDNTHILIDANDPNGCFKVAQKLHILGEYKYRQIRFRSTIAPKSLNYIMVKLEEIMFEQ